MAGVRRVPGATRTSAAMQVLWRSTALGMQQLGSVQPQSVLWSSTVDIQIPFLGPLNFDPPTADLNKVLTLGCLIGDRVGRLLRESEPPIKPAKLADRNTVRWGTGPGTIDARI